MQKHFNQLMKVNVTSDVRGYHGFHCMMCWEEYFTCMVLFLKIHNPSLILRKVSGKSQLRDILQTPIQYLSSCWCHMKNEDETATKQNKELWQLNIMRCPELDPGTEKYSNGKTDITVNKVWCLINSDMPVSVSYFWQRYQSNVRW